jgi:hypothetical protein
MNTNGTKFAAYVVDLSSEDLLISRLQDHDHLGLWIRAGQCLKDFQSSPRLWGLASTSGDGTHPAHVGHSYHATEPRAILPCGPY